MDVAALFYAESYYNVGTSTSLDFADLINHFAENFPVESLTGVGTAVKKSRPVHAVIAVGAVESASKSMHPWDAATGPAVETAVGVSKP